MKTRLQILAALTALVLFVILSSYEFGRQTSRAPVPPISKVESKAVPNEMTGVASPVRVDLPSSGAPRREEVVGIGVALKYDRDLGMPRIAMVLPNSQASQSGLAPGAVIVKIDGALTKGLGLKECVARIQGALGSKIILEVVNVELEETNLVELTRQRVVL